MATAFLDKIAATTTTPPDPPTPPGGAGQAAVLALFRPGDRGTEVFMIQRAKREGDPWAGHIALPGGRWEREDKDLRQTALREAREEVGLDAGQLEGAPLFVGFRAPANRPELQVGVFLAVLKDGAGGPASAGPEVDAMFWAPIPELSPSAGPVEVPVPRGSFRAEALVYRDYVVWGFTRRVLLDLLERFGDLMGGVPTSHGDLKL